MRPALSVATSLSARFPSTGSGQLAANGEAVSVPSGDQIPVEQRDRPVSAFGQGVAQRPGDRRLAGPGQPGEKHDHAALPPRRAGPAQLGGHARGRVPGRHILATVEQILQFARGQVGLFGARLDQRERAPHLGRTVVGPFAAGHHRDRGLDVGIVGRPAATVGIPFVHEQVGGAVRRGDHSADGSLPRGGGVPRRERHRHQYGARWQVLGPGRDRPHQRLRPHHNLSRAADQRQEQQPCLELAGEVA